MAKIKNVFGMSICHLGEPWKEVYADIRISPRATSTSGIACSHNKIAVSFLGMIMFLVY